MAVSQLLELRGQTSQLSFLLMFSREHDASLNTSDLQTVSPHHLHTLLITDRTRKMT